MTDTNFPYYPEPLNQPEGKKDGQKEEQPKDFPFANILNNLDNLNTNNLISSLLSSGMFGKSTNPLMMQALTKILNKQESTKKEGSSPSCTFEDL